MTCLGVRRARRVVDHHAASGPVGGAHLVTPFDPLVVREALFPSRVDGWKPRKNFARLFSSKFICAFSLDIGVSTHTPFESLLILYLSAPFAMSRIAFGPSVRECRLQTATANDRF